MSYYLHLLRVYLEALELYLQSSRSCNSSHCKAYMTSSIVTPASLACLTPKPTTLNIAELASYPTNVDWTPAPRRPQSSDELWFLTPTRIGDKTGGSVTRSGYPQPLQSCLEDALRRYPREIDNYQGQCEFNSILAHYTCQPSCMSCPRWGVRDGSRQCLYAQLASHQTPTSTEIFGLNKV